MADRQLECPVPRISECNDILATTMANFSRVALAWRALAERRYDGFIELQRSGRWKHYYDYPEFIRELHAAAALAERWTEIAPTIAVGVKPSQYEDKQQIASAPAKAA